MGLISTTTDYQFLPPPHSPEEISKNPGTPYIKKKPQASQAQGTLKTEDTLTCLDEEAESSAKKAEEKAKKAIIEPQVMLTSKPHLEKPSNAYLSALQSIGKIQDSPLDKGVLSSVADHRKNLSEGTALSFAEINRNRTYCKGLQTEINEHHDALIGSGKNQKKWSWLAKGANATSAALGIVALAVTLATGGFGAVLGALVGVAKLVETGAETAKGIYKIKDQKHQAALTLVKHQRDELLTKDSSLLQDSQSGERRFFSLWKLSRRIIKNLNSTINNLNN